MTDIVLTHHNAAAINGQPNDFADVLDNDNDIKDVVNGNLDNDNIATGAAIALSKLASGSSGALTLTGGATSLSNYSDTQSGAITSNGVLTGISISPAAGGYLAIGTATAEGTGGLPCDVRLELRVAASVAVIGQHVVVLDPSQACVFGILIVTTGQAVDLYGQLGVNSSVDEGRLILLKVA